MLIAYARDDAVLGAHELAQLPDVPFPAGAHLREEDVAVEPAPHRPRNAHRRVVGLRRRQDAEFFRKHLRRIVLDARLAEAPRDAHLDAGARREQLLRPCDVAAVVRELIALHEDARKRRDEGKEEREEGDGQKAEEKEKIAVRRFRGKPQPAAHPEDENGKQHKAASPEAHHARRTAERHLECMAGGEDIQNAQPHEGNGRNEAGKRAPQKGEAERKEGDEQDLAEGEEGVAPPQHIVLPEVPAEEPALPVAALLQHSEDGRHAETQHERRGGRTRRKANDHFKRHPKTPLPPN